MSGGKIQQNLFVSKINGQFGTPTGDVARTSDGWAESENFGWYILKTAGSVSAEYDSAITRAGRLTLKLSATDTSGRIRAALQQNFEIANTTVAIASKYGIPVKPLTAYRLNCYVKTNNAASNSVYLTGMSFKSDATVIASSDYITNKLSGTQDWSLLTVTFITPALSNWISLRMMLNVAGNISDAWFDINSMTLTEVSPQKSKSIKSH